MANIIFITGTPGVGKTTVARLLAKKLRLKMFSLHDIAMKIRHKRYIKKLESYEIEPRYIREALEKEVKNIYESIIVEGHLVDSIPSNMVSRVIILRAHPKVLEKRLREKKYSEKKIRENILCEILDYILIQCLKVFDKNIVCEVDTSNHRVEEIVDIIENILNRNKCGEYSVGKIDWINILERENLLDRYLLQQIF